MSSDVPSVQVHLSHKLDLFIADRAKFFYKMVGIALGKYKGTAMSKLKVTLRPASVLIRILLVQFVNL